MIAPSSGKQTILVVDDEPSIREVLSAYLEHGGYRVILASDGEDAIEAVETQQPDLVILDIMLPKVGGLEVTRWIRRNRNIPIIMVTGRRDEQDRILGLDLGADDYVVKPFSPREVVSRVKAVLRRTLGPTGESGSEILEFDGLRLDAGARAVEVNGESVMLTATEFDLLWELARHAGQVLNRTQLLDLVWGTSAFLEPSTVTVHIRRLREKIEADPSKPVRIQTVWGVGYRLDP